MAWLASGHCVGRSRGLAPGSQPLRRPPGARGGAAEHPFDSRTSGQGVASAPKSLIPALESRVPRAG